MASCMDIDTSLSNCDSRINDNDKVTIGIDISVKSGSELCSIGKNVSQSPSNETKADDLNCDLINKAENGLEYGDKNINNDDVEINGSVSDTAKSSLVNGSLNSKLDNSVKQKENSSGATSSQKEKELSGAAKGCDKPSENGKGNNKKRKRKRNQQKNAAKKSDKSNEEKVSVKNVELDCGQQLKDHSDVKVNVNDLNVNDTTAVMGNTETTEQNSTFSTLSEDSGVDLIDTNTKQHDSPETESIDTKANYSPEADLNTDTKPNNSKGAESIDSKQNDSEEMELNTDTKPNNSQETECIDTKQNDSEERELNTDTLQNDSHETKLNAETASLEIEPQTNHESNPHDCEQSSEINITDKTDTDQNMNCNGGHVNLDESEKAQSAKSASHENPAGNKNCDNKAAKKGKKKKKNLATQTSKSNVEQNDCLTSEMVTKMEENVREMQENLIKMEANIYSPGTHNDSDEPEAIKENPQTTEGDHQTTTEDTQTIKGDQQSSDKNMDKTIQGDSKNASISDTPDKITDKEINNVNKPGDKEIVLSETIPLEENNVDVAESKLTLQEESVIKNMENKKMEIKVKMEDLKGKRDMVSEKWDKEVESMDKSTEAVDLRAPKLESEVTMLREELVLAHKTVKTTQGYLRDHQAKHNSLVMTLKLQLYQGQAALKSQRRKSDQQMADVLSHLVFLEGKLRKEQRGLRHQMKDKNEQIEQQQREILKLKDQNEQLLNAIKEICAKGGMNGYMRENKRKSSNSSSDLETPKNGKDKKLHNGKLSSVKDKFSWKNRSSLELSHFNLEKYLIKNDRLCSSQEDLQNLGKGKNQGNTNDNVSPISREVNRHSDDPWVRRKITDSINGHDVRRSESPKSGKNMQNFFSESESPTHDLHKSTSDSSQISENSNSSGIYSLSDHDRSNADSSFTNGSHGNDDYDVDEDDDDRHFSFSSTHINQVIDENDVIGPIMSHSGQMMSMGSMPMLANNYNNEMEQNLSSAKNRPHSLSSVDLASIQQQAKNLSRFHSEGDGSPEMSTPPPSPSYNQSKNDVTPFQQFKSMFKRKGSKNKGNKKRSVSLSQTTNQEYSEALKKHFQKYDMS